MNGDFVGVNRSSLNGMSLVEYGLHMVLILFVADFNDSVNGRKNAFLLTWSRFQASTFARKLWDRVVLT